jgi:hypothetical protein
LGGTSAAGGVAGGLIVVKSLHAASIKGSGQRGIRDAGETCVRQSDVIEAIGGKDEECVKEMVGFGMAYSEVAREDHRLFVDVFRNGQIQGLRARCYVTVLTSEL